MSRDALKDAFIAGWHRRAGLASQPFGFDADQAFSDWYTNTVNTLDRANPDGWIEWDGSADMPPGLSRDDHVEVKLRNRKPWENIGRAVEYRWQYYDSLYEDDITHYRRSRS